MVGRDRHQEGQSFKYGTRYDMVKHRLQAYTFKHYQNHIQTTNNYHKV